MGLALKKKDKIIVLSGKDRGKTGEILRVLPWASTVLVSKLNIIKRHTRGSAQQPGGIIEQEAPLQISKVMLICPKCSKPTRSKADRLTDGKKVRICRRCGEIIV